MQHADDVALYHIGRSTMTASHVMATVATMPWRSGTNHAPSALIVASRQADSFKRIIPTTG